MTKSHLTGVERENFHIKYIGSILFRPVLKLPGHPLA